MNLNITIDWKTITALGVAGVSCILAKKTDKEDAKELLNNIITTAINKFDLKALAN